MKKSELLEPCLPHRIKPTEEDRINPAYVNLTADERFTPQKNVVYLWAYNSRKELIVGIDKPWEYPEAFNIDTTDEQQMKVWERISTALQTLLEGIDKHYGFGHPTLTADFDEKGNVKVGLAHLGGELRFIAGEWIINNKSGRFGKKKEATAETQKLVENTIIEVASLFNDAGIQVVPKLDFSNPKIYSTLYTEKTKQTFWSANNQEEQNSVEAQNNTVGVNKPSDFKR